MAIFEVKVDNAPLTANLLANQLTQEGNAHANQVGIFPTFSYFLVRGDDQQLQKEAIEAIQAFAVDEKYYGCNEIEIYTDTEKYEIRDILDNVNNEGFFGTRRFIKFVFTKAPNTKALKDLELLVKAADTLNIYCFSFLTWSKTLTNSAFFKALTAIDQAKTAYGPIKAVSIQCYPKTGNLYKQVIRARLKSFKLSYDNEVIDLLSYMFENNLTSLVQILEQIKMRGITELTEEVVLSTSEQLSDYTVHDFIMAVISRNVKRAFDILSYLQNHKKVASVVIIFHLKLLLTNLYKWRESGEGFDIDSLLCQNSRFPSNVENEMSFYCRRNRDRVKDIKEQLSFTLTRRRLYNLFILLSDIDIGSKTRFTESQTFEYIQKFVNAFIFNSNYHQYELFLDDIRIFSFNDFRTNEHSTSKKSNLSDHFILKG